MKNSGKKKTFEGKINGIPSRDVGYSASTPAPLPHFSFLELLRSKCADITPLASRYAGGNEAKLPYLLHP